ncbi:hypothetical protein BX600DRAFT_552005 [Xylariales sp. PMI_506]|nr:hypothetical protein BX600DRAFT_552005 [Xylariales sp. PMI_506]
MKTAFVTAFASVLGLVSAFNGQVDYHGSTGSEGSNPQVFLTDYDTGSTYYTGAVVLTPDVWSNVYFIESSAGGYDFNARVKTTSTNCFHVDFEGALDAGWYYCCGGVPCDLQPK